VTPDVDYAVVGAGVVGLAIAERLASRGSVMLIERREGCARETSAHNTGIVHAGMFYETGSLKHRLCIEGARLLHEWCDARNVPLRRTGKLIVAVEAADLDGLERVWTHAEVNGVPGMRRLARTEAQAMEPAVRFAEAIACDASSVVDQAAYARSLESAARGGEGFTLALEDAGGVASTLRCGVLVNAAGHGAPRLAEAAGYPLDGDAQTRAVRQRVNRGRYYDFATPDLTRVVSRPVYPVPPGAADVQRHQASAGGLGLHLSVDIDGVAHLGPDTSWLPDDALLDYRADDDAREAFLVAGRRLLPALRLEDLVPGQVGYRPKLVSADGTPPDFSVWRDGAYVHLGGIESPGLTASLALARHVEALLV
jgi:L-2-hydroxyglutarate oxidase LhgO